MASIEMILRAADTYYSNTLGKTETYPLEISFPDNENKLGIKGRQPDFGQLIIYDDGTIFLEVTYDDVTYTKQKNETKVSKNKRIVGSSAIWITDGNGTIKAYKNESVTETGFRVKMFDIYIYIGSLYVNGTSDERYPLDEKLTLQENVEKLEREGIIDSSGLPNAANVEITKYFELCSSLKGQGQDKLLEEAQKREDDFTYMLDYATVTNMGNNVSNRVNSLIYIDILKMLDKSKTIVIPNFVLHEDGTTEDIVAIGIGGTSILPTNISENKDLIISKNIVWINSRAFSGAKLASVVLPSTIEFIDSYAFYGNNFTTITIPGSIKHIGQSAFDCYTLETVNIETKQNDDLDFHSTAFGGVIPTYQS